MKKLLVYLIVAAALGAAGFGAWRLYATGSHQQTKFRTAPAQRGDLSATINATGTLEPEEVIDVGAQVAGLIKEFGRDPRDSTRPIDYGSPVEKDTVLAEIDASLYASAVDKAKADLGRARKANVESAEANLLVLRAKQVQTERDWKRAQELGPTKAISALDYDTAQNAYESAKASVPGGVAAVDLAKETVKASGEALKQAEINLGYCTIASPVKGVIIDRRVNVGQTVVSSLNAPSLFLIAKDLKRMQVWASVNEADIGRIHAGQPVSFTVDAFPGEQFHGSVAPDQPRLNATMTQNVVTYTVVVNTDNSSGRLLPYLTANVEFEVSRRSNVLLIPNAALRWQPTPEQVAPDARDAFLKALKRQSAAQAASTASGDKPAPTAEKEPRDHGRVWVEDQGFVRSVKVQIGLSDGVNTEIVGGDLKEGTSVIIGEDHTDTGTAETNPFAPKLFGPKKQ